MPKAASSVARDYTNPYIVFHPPESATDAERELAQRVVSRCVKSDPPSDPLARPVRGACWLWMGPRSPEGYGRIGDAYTHRITTFAPKGFDVDHLCRVPACCNPQHLEVVTHAENIRRGKNGRNQSGSCWKCGSTKLWHRSSRAGRSVSMTMVCRDCQNAKDRVRKAIKAWNKAPRKVDP